MVDIRMGVHLVLDASIRNWAFLPIMMATFLVGLIRMYISQAVGGQGSTNFSVATKENLVQLQVTMALTATLRQVLGAWGKNLERGPMNQFFGIKLCRQSKGLGLYRRWEQV